LWRSNIPGRSGASPRKTAAPRARKLREASRVLKLR